ncbi:MAG: LacI family DNA-binding transcriptional regulator [Clostridia bacterium]
MITLKEIAERCGCSVATVSKSLNEMPDISALTAQRVRDAASEMGYQPNAAARTLKTNRSRTIGLMFFLDGRSVWSHEYFGMIAASIQSEMEESGYDLTPINCDGVGMRASQLNYCRYRGYDGLIVMSVGSTGESFMELIDSEIPLVTIDYEFHHRGAVISDNVQGMRDLLTYIHGRGHRRIAFIHGEDTSVTRNRLASYYTFCDEAGLCVPDAYVKPAIYRQTQRAQAATRELLALAQPPTCILYPDDYAAVGGLNEFRRQHITVPAQISIAGYDGIELARDLTPMLTTIQQDTTGIGRHAARMLLKAIEKPRNFIPRHMVLPGKLLEGGTVKDLTVPDAG